MASCASVGLGDLGARAAESCQRSSACKGAAELIFGMERYCNGPARSSTSPMQAAIWRLLRGQVLRERHPSVLRRSRISQVTQPGLDWGPSAAGPGATSCVWPCTRAQVFVTSQHQRRQGRACQRLLHDLGDCRCALPCVVCPALALFHGDTARSNESFAGARGSVTTTAHEICIRPATDRPALIHHISPVTIMVKGNVTNNTSYCYSAWTTYSRCYSLAQQLACLHLPL